MKYLIESSSNTDLSLFMLACTAGPNFLIDVCVMPEAVY
jgi:hypothetical protein